MAEILQLSISGEDLMGDDTDAIYADTGDPVVIGDTCYAIIREGAGRIFFKLRESAWSYGKAFG